MAETNKEFHCMISNKEVEVYTHQIWMASRHTKRGDQAVTAERLIT